MTNIDNFCPGTKGSFALGDDDDDKKMGCMDTNGTVHTRR